MDDKENTSSKSKIPIPLAPLPPLKGANPSMARSGRKPLSVVGNDQWVTKRRPLQPPPTPYYMTRKKYVTVRQADDDLDWDFKELKNDKGKELRNDKGKELKNDKKGDEKIGDDNDDGAKCLEVNKNIKPGSDERVPTIKISSTKVTPGDLTKSLQVKQIKNIKRSLKRPHSRELLGSDTVTAKKKLFRGTSSTDGLDELMQLYSEVPHDLRQSIADHLLKTEKKLHTSPIISKMSRACINNWLLKVNGRGDIVVLQTACWYLDSVLSMKRIQLENLQLVGCACFWIAQKHIGPPCTATHMVKLTKNAFSSTTLAAVESKLLHVLNWPPPAITPSDYLGFITQWFGPDMSSEMEMAANFLILCSLVVDVNYNREYPSVIVAAAIKNAVLLLKNQDLLKKLQNNSWYQTVICKSENFSYICSAQRLSARELSSVSFDYRSAYDIYSGPPSYIAERIVKAAAEYSVTDYRNVTGSTGNDLNFL